MKRLTTPLVSGALTRPYTHTRTQIPPPPKKNNSYGSFALISGHPASLAVLAWTAMLNLTSLGGRAAGHAARGGAEYEKYVARTPAVVPWRLLL